MTAKYELDKDRLDDDVSDDSALESDMDSSSVDDCQEHEWDSSQTSGVSVDSDHGRPAELPSRPNRRSTMTTSHNSTRVQKGTVMKARRSSRCSSSKKESRLLMRAWLKRQAEAGVIANISWYDDQHTKIRIPWKHGSRSGWTLDDCQLYRAWAEHTGKYSGNVDEPKRWKANFRCALNSLPDMQEVKDLGQTRGRDPFKVYEFLPERPRKSHAKKAKRFRREKVVYSSSPEPVVESPEITYDEQVSEFEDLTSLEVAWPDYCSFTCSYSYSSVPTVDDYSQTQESSGTKAVIPTVVEEMAEDPFDGIELETLSAVSSTSSSEEYDSSFTSTSSVSSVDLLEEEFGDFNDVIPSWGKTETYTYLSLPISEDFIRLSNCPLT